MLFSCLDRVQRCSKLVGSSGWSAHSSLVLLRWVGWDVWCCVWQWYCLFFCTALQFGMDCAKLFGRCRIESGTLCWYSPRVFQSWLVWLFSMCLFALIYCLLLMRYGWRFPFPRTRLAGLVGGVFVTVNCLHGQICSVLLSSRGRRPARPASEPLAASVVAGDRP